MPRHWLFRDVLVPFLATRALLLIVAATSLSVLPHSPYSFPEWETVTDPLLSAFSRWDGLWYREIAEDGYTYEPGGQSSVSFFPLYPMLMRAVGTLVGAADHTALAAVGVLLSNIALGAGVALLVALVRLDHDEDTASRAALYTLAFPTSFFLSSVYADVLFLLLTVAAFLAARHQRWWIAGLLGGLTALSRPHGVLIALPLALEYALQHGWSWRSPFRTLARFRPSLLALGLVPAGLVLYMTFLGVAFGAPLAFVETQSAGWGRGFAMPWDTLAQFFSEPLTMHRNEHSLLDLAFAVGLGACAVAAWRLTRPSYALLATVILVGALSSGTLISLMRVGAALFPVPIVLAVVGRDPRVDRLVLVVGSVLGGLFMALFAQHYWVA
jgi:hypothetical protein